MQQRQTGFLECKGDAVSRTTYAALFAVLGTTYGAGDGSSTFNVPDFQGRHAAGVSSNVTIRRKINSQQITSGNAYGGSVSVGLSTSHS
jgi:microcystin-dependent protein